MIYKQTLSILFLSIFTILFSSCSTINHLYKSEVTRRMNQEQVSAKIITPSDLRRLPEPISKYVERCGWVGKPIPQNFTAYFSGYFSLKKGKYVKVEAEQYSFLTPQEGRYYTIKSPLFSGRHRLDERGSFMLIKLFGLFKISAVNGKEMEQSELVTYFNDICFLAPGILPLIPVDWVVVDDKTVLATVSGFRRTITATLIFNADGDLIDFKSNDRYATAKGELTQKYPWSTTMYDYRKVDGIRRPSRGEATWHMPDGDFEYARMVVDSVHYNLNETEFKSSSRRAVK